jgi:hypothetical protein
MITSMQSQNSTCLLLLFVVICFTLCLFRQESGCHMEMNVLKSHTDPTL